MNGRGASGYTDTRCTQFKFLTGVSIKLSVFRIYRIAGIIRGGIIFALFTVQFHPRKINPRNIAGGIGSTNFKPANNPRNTKASPSREN